MSTLRAVLVVALGAGGIWFLVASVPWWRSAHLSTRLTPYVSATPMGSSSIWSWSFLRTLLGGFLDRHLPTGDLATRLASLGRSTDIVAQRTEQAAWGLIGMAGGIGLSVIVAATGRGLSPLMALMLIVVGGAGGAIAWDRRITRAVQRRREAAAAEFPIVADLLCLAVTAGESLRGGLALVAQSINGPLAEEIQWALRDARSGRTLAASLTERAVVLGEPGFERFVRSVIAATERGVAIASSLQSMAADARDVQRVALVEAAGRKQVTMLIPVVGLILPVALVFAFFPGIVAIRHLT
ncbi:MAG: pilus assembly protein TadB [Actinobacteria bacterium]|uniref:Unannotated protein n=1 Tax=freshwater metagenome TaxID=449393 RepID=A0A6J7NE60_9ZZZZ|nr:pilus assembly protein TadB [Actinomycetota bacterium]